jgi:hypothetical protein
MTGTSKYNLLLVLNYFSYCLFDDLIVAIGKSTNSFSGLFNYIVNIGYRVNGDDEVQAEFVAAVDDEDWENAGLYLTYWWR